MTNGDVLDGWKTIAAYVGKSVKTIQRWEADAGFPVHRIPGRRSVFALRQEVDQWLLEQQGEASAPSDSRTITNQPVDPHPVHWMRRMRRVTPLAWGIIAMGVVFLAAWGWKEHRSLAGAAGRLHASFQPVSQDQRNLVVTNSRGIPVLVHTMSEEFVRRGYSWMGQVFYKIQDTNGNGRDDVVVLDMKHGLPVIKIWQQESGGSLALTHELAVDDGLTWNGRRYLQNRCWDFCLSDLDGDGNAELIVSVRHDAFFPSMVKVMTLSGEPILTVEHPGWLNRVQVRHLPEGTVLLVSGTNNFITVFSEPILMKLSMDWRTRGKRFSLMRPGRKMAPVVPAGVTLTYMRFGAFPHQSGTTIWEPAVLRSFLPSVDEKSILLDVGFYITARAERPLVDHSAVEQIRLFQLKPDLSLFHAEYNDVVVQTLELNPQESRYQALLVPSYWNGRTWQRSVCQVPVSTASQ